MASGVRFLLDANAFIDMGERFYPEDVFACVWSQLLKELSQATAFTTKGVLTELKRVKPLPPWRANVISACDANAVDEGESAIQTIYARLAPEAQHGGALPAGLSAIDLFVLATGEYMQAPIVTRDAEITLSCDRGLVNTRALGPAEYFKELGWYFA